MLFVFKYKSLPIGLNITGFQDLIPDFATLSKLESTSSIFDISSTSSLAGGVLFFPLSARGVGHVVPIWENML